MSKKKTHHFASFSGGLLAALGYFAVIRPWYLNWGSKGFENDITLPGDELMATPKVIVNRSIQINASPEKVWPWLVQIGYQRAGWYSYDSLENAVGVAEFMDGHSSTRIIPELQDLQVGDSIPAAPAPYLKFDVVQMKKPEAIVLHAIINPISGKNLDVENFNSSVWLRQIWTFYLAETYDCKSHLIFRSRVDYGPKLIMNPFNWFLVEPAHFVMEQKMLKGIKLRAENYS